ncbi:MAG: hypothetical protein WDM76_19260 [Limisphaerales bacterium]
MRFWASSRRCPFPRSKRSAKSNANIAASRQLLNDIARARQLAMSQRTTVYMVFVPDEFLEHGFRGIQFHVV